MEGIHMDTLFLVCAILGGTILVCQFVMTLVGLGGHDMVGDHDLSVDAHHEIGHHDAGHDQDHGDSGHHNSSWFVGVLSFRTLVAAATFFGLAGKFGLASGYSMPKTLSVAVVAGMCSMFLVAWMMQGLYRLRADGTVRIERAVGAPGTVYLTIPAAKSGVGKVTLKLQDRTMEYHAVTSNQQEIPTGTEVVAVAVVGPGTIEVSPVPSSERVAHA
jgi:hypothetical protein